MIYHMNKRRKRPKKCPSMLDRDIKCAEISTYLPIVNTLFPLNFSCGLNEKCDIAVCAGSSGISNLYIYVCS